ncbi:MAG: ATP-binding protein [Verrucomicrobiota bacterium]
MAELPTGTVTFLFTDIEGSTRMLHELGDAYGEALAAHRRVLRQAFGAHGGIEVDTQGDAFFYAFPDAEEAAAAAEEAQAALAGGPVSVRMGLHTGKPGRTDEGYFGLDVHLGARIAAAAHGGQVVLSKATRDRLDAVAVRDLGEHRVKDFDAPVWIYQLGDAPFPPLKTISNTNLPRPRSSFIGREPEVAEVCRLVRESGLVTLTGPGGSGKTRVAIEAASELIGEFRNGVYWVALATISDPGLVTETIARALGARNELMLHIGERELLLVLDNLEQVIDSAPELAHLLEACPNLKLLVTSRELLRVRGEVEFQVLSLAAPDAVELFTARTQLPPSSTVGEICRGLDNMPLAVELAAARTKALAPEQILERLGERLDLFHGGRDAEERQTTLRATIEWSHDLLSRSERTLFGRLGVFTGGCSIGSAETVADADLDTIQSLVEKSLVRHTDDRFWMLETIRDYAVERLEKSAEAAELRDRHADHFLELAERVEPELATDRQAAWLDVLERDYANMRSALAWFLARGESGKTLRLAGALRPFWFRRGYLGEGRRWLDDVLEASVERTPPRAKALAAAGLLAALQADWAETRRWSQAAYELGRELDEPRYAAWALMTLGRATLAEGDPDGAVAIYEEAEMYGREAGDPVETVAMVAFNLGYIALSRDDFDQARGHFERAAEQFGDDRYGVARSLAALGSVAIYQGRHDDAVATLQRSLRVSSEVADRDDIAWALQLLGVAYSESAPVRSARLLGAAEAMRESLGGRLEGAELALHERALKALASVEDETRSAEWDAGRRLAFHDAVDYALSDV